MDPGHRDAHLRLWTDLTRRAQPGYIPAPASLLAFDIGIPVTARAEPSGHLLEVSGS